MVLRRGYQPQLNIEEEPASSINFAGESGKSGVNYVRWGKTTCPSGAEIVYKGIH